MFAGLLTIADNCSTCGLSFTNHEVGDGPAFFAILIIGALTATGAAIVEIKYQPPFWVHAALWIPFVLVGSVASLRFLKGLLIAVQYHLKREDFDS